METGRSVVRYPRSRSHTHECIDPGTLLQKVILQIKANRSLVFCPCCGKLLSEAVCSFGVPVVDLTKVNLRKSCVPCSIIWELDARSDPRIVSRFSATPFLFLKGVYNCAHQQFVFEEFETDGWIAL